MIRRQAIATLAALALLAGAATAQPVAANSTATLVAPAPAVSMFVLPNGSGTPLSACFDNTGATVAAAITVTINDAAGLPVAGVPARDIRLHQMGSGMSWCPDFHYPPPLHAPNCADAPTNAAGQTRFTLRYHGGGWHNAGLQVWVLEASGAWMPIPNVLPVHMNSADNTGDLVVNLSDIVTFTNDLMLAPPPYRSDYNWDGVINLTDIVRLATSIGVTCP